MACGCFAMTFFSGKTMNNQADSNPIATRTFSTRPPLRSFVDGKMRVDKNVAIEVEDGRIVMADVYRPDTTQQYPAVMCFTPLRQGHSFRNERASRLRAHLYEE